MTRSGGANRERIRFVRRALVGPLIAVYRLLPDKAVIDADAEHWALRREVYVSGSEERLAHLLAFDRAFRNLFYWRVERTTAWASIAVVMARRVWPPLASLDIACEEIGPGLVIAHGYGTILNADRIGANCWIHQQVTIGWDYGGGRPTLEDDVFIGAGAKVLGSVVVGRGARIGANAVVLEDVPPGATAVGVPARIVRRGESIAGREAERDGRPGNVDSSLPGKPRADDTDELARPYQDHRIQTEAHGCRQSTCQETESPLGKERLK
jgi:serine O-acetyltransferase